MDLKSIGARLRTERERVGLSQEQLAEVAGTNRMTPSRYEQGSHVPTLGFLASIETAGVDIGYVLTGKRSIVSLGLDDAALLGRAMAVVDDLLEKHRFAPSEEVRGRLVLQVLRDATSSNRGSKGRTPSLDKLIAELSS